MLILHTAIKSRLLPLLLVALTLTGCNDNDNNDSPAVGNANPPQAKLYIFGDSLSDTGNLGRPASFGDDLPVPFFENRISNGRVIVEYIAESLQTSAEASNYLDTEEEGTNYAIAGANALDKETFINLDLQIESYLMKNDDEVNPDNFYLFFIGGNDVIDAVSLGEAGGRELLSRAAVKVGEGVDAIVSRGGREIVLLTVPNIGRTAKFQAAPAAEAALATVLTQHFNAEVQSIVQGYESNTVRLTTIDLYAALEDVLSRASELGFTNTTQGCYNIDDLSFEVYCSAEQLDSFVFFDDIHPTGKTHRLLGEEAARQLTAAIN